MQRRALVDTVHRSYRWWLAAKSRFSLTERQRLFGLTIAIGGICGLLAVAFHLAIRGVEELTIDRAFEASGSSWMIWVVAVPALGALGAGILLLVVPGARGSGVPQVKVAYATGAMKLRIRDSVGKFFIGALQVGTGSSLGREGPTVQICSGAAKAIGKLAGVSPQNLKLLLPVGAAAGIAAAFNAPIAAVTFTIEEIVGNLDQTLLSGVIVAAAFAAVVERSILGENPVFTIPQGYGLDHASSLVVYAALGVAAALISVAFTESLLWMRARFKRLHQLPIWSRPMVGGLATGVLAVAVMEVLHLGGITGGGYTTLADSLSGKIVVESLLVVGAARLVATVLAYASGGAGGIFATTLFAGAVLGNAFGAIDIETFGHAGTELGAFALVGMGAMFAGTIRAPITSVLIIIEMTGGYGLVLPLMISNMIAYGLARAMRPRQIYDAFLVQDGIELAPHGTDPLDGLQVAAIPLATTPVITFSRRDSAQRALELAATAGSQEVFPVTEHERLIGVVTLEDLTVLAAEPDLGGLVYVADLMRPPVHIRADDLAPRALAVMAALETRTVLVVDADSRVIGILEESAIAREYLRARTAAQRGDHG